MFIPLKVWQVIFAIAIIIVIILVVRSFLVAH